ncbi:MAG: hypothetical protein NDJ94_14760 [Vicinamibacteria bacterium]|nr:hypothetical protein [Vicinamibacteria bacterium]
MPELSLPRLGGGLELLAALWADGPAALAIGHSECATSRLALPYVERLRARIPPPMRVGLVVQEDEAGARAFAAELGLQAPPLFEREPYPMADALGLRTVPTLLLIESGGRVARVIEGFERTAYEAVAAALGVAPLFTEADGALKRRPG